MNHIYKAGDIVVCVQHPEGDKETGAKWEFERVFTIDKIINNGVGALLLDKDHSILGVYSNYVLPLLEYIAKKYPVGTRYKSTLTGHNWVVKKDAPRFIQDGNMSVCLSDGIVYDKKKGFAEIISKLEEDWKLPEKWCVKLTEHNYQQVYDWFNNYYNDNYKGLDDGYYMHYPKVKLKYSGTISCSCTIKEGYTEITFDQFLKHVVKKVLPQEIPKECQKMWEESDYKFTVTFQTINNKQNEKSNSIEVQRKAPKISRGKGVTGNSISGRRVRTTISIGHLSHKTVSIK